MKPFLQIRKAIKRNASFDSDDVRELVLNLLDSLEQDAVDAPDEDEIFLFSVDTERFSEELKEALSISDKKADEDDGEDE